MTRFEPFHLVEKLAVLPIRLVGGDPVQRHDTQSHRLADQPGGDLGLGLEARRLGDVDLLATVPARLGLFAPILGQVELMVQQGRATGGDAHQEDADLAVVLLAQAAVVLPSHAGAVVALLGEAALVDHPDHSDRAGGRRRHQLVGEDGLDLGLDVVVTPGRDVDELPKRRDLTVADVQGDRLDALAFGADHQPLDVGIGMILSLFLAEEGGESLVKLNQTLGRGAHFVLGHGGYLHRGEKSDDVPARLSTTNLHDNDGSRRSQRFLPL